VCAELSPTIQVELMRLAERNVLGEGEIICELEEVLYLDRLGVLVVTDLRVLFVRSGFLRRRTEITSIGLDDVKSVEAIEDPLRLRKWGMVSIVRRSGYMNRADFGSIRGGHSRAEEITRTILRQREYLERGTRAHDARDSPAAVASEDEGTPRLDVLLGWGVESYVNRHGGRLYVWGEPIGELEWMKASTTPPETVGFVRFDGINAFELYVEENLVNAPHLRLARRWFPRPGIAVDTGLVLAQ
jgi:hypothetical protein